jgi:hypothetical protein
MEKKLKEIALKLPLAAEGAQNVVPAPEGKVRLRLADALHLNPPISHKHIYICVCVYVCVSLSLSSASSLLFACFADCHPRDIHRWLSSFVGCTS